MDRFKGKSYRRLLPALLPLLFFGSAPAQAAPDAPSGYAHCREMNRLLHWPCFPLRVFLAPGFLGLPERRAQVLAGMDEWVHATQGAVCYQVVPDEAAAQVTVLISSRITLPGDPRAVGQTALTYSGAQLTKAVIQMVSADDSPEQFQEISAHEFGHALGIDGHSDDPQDMMFPVLSHSLFQVRNLELDWPCQPGMVTTRDVDTLASAYPALPLAPKRH